MLAGKGETSRKRHHKRDFLLESRRNLSSFSPSPSYQTRSRSTNHQIVGSRSQIKKKEVPQFGDTMAEPSKRASRSRYSSPFATPHNSGANSSKADVAEKPKTFMDRWIEPQLPPARPSFAEAGIERHGVVANMAPLGTRPSAKVLKASARPEPLQMPMETATRSSTRRAGQQSSVTTPTPSEAISTPEPSVNIIRRRSLSSKADTSEQAPQTPPPRPKSPQTPTASSRKSVPQPSTSIARQEQGQGVFALQHSPLPKGAPRQSMSSFLPPPSQFGPNGEYQVNLEMTDRVVESAVQEAVDNRRWPTAYALRTLYDDHRLNPRMVRLIDTIYNGRADENQLKEFKGVMKHKKKEGKKDRTGEYYFNGDGSDPLPGPSQFSPSRTRTPSFSGPSGRAVTGNRSRNMSSASASMPSSASPSPHKESEHISKKHKTGKPTAHSLGMNVDAAGHVKSPQNPAAHQNGIAHTGRQRAISNTSTSSLSSVDEHILNDEYNINAGTHAHPQSRSAHAEASGARLATRPISATKQTGPKTYTFSTVTASSSAVPSSPTNRNSNAHLSFTSTGDVMAPAALLALESSGAPAQRKGKKDSAVVTGAAHDENDPAVRMKRKAREVTNKSVPVQESFERRPRRGLAASESASERGGSVPPVAAKRTTLRLLNKKTRQSCLNYDSDNHSSPTLLSFRPDLAPGSLPGSRAGTPSTSGRPGRKAKTGTGLRVKTSPVKKKGGGPLAGLPRPSGERSPTGNGASNIMDENDDYCCCCGGIGELVCCDGCSRSFHFNCVDPPMAQSDLPNEWFCRICKPSGLTPADIARGMFSTLRAHLSKKNPSSFFLPKSVRDHFVDVKTGPQGEYDESPHPKPKNRAGYDEAPDYFRLKDNKGKAILCHHCHRAASAPDRAIIPCTYCNLYWHLDCLDVPLAKEPGPGRPFRCPAHIDDVLVDLPHSLYPAHRFRRIKGASAIRPAMTRGIPNNGHIEIENDPTDDEKELGFYEQREYGRVYKLPEMGIKLDFISQVRRKTGGRGGYAPVPSPPSPPKVQAPKSMTLDQRSYLEQQVALILASLSIPHPPVGSVSMLIRALISQATPEVLGLIARADADNLASNKLDSDDRNALIALRALLDAKIDAFKEKAPEGAAATEKKAAENEAVMMDSLLYDKYSYDDGNGGPSNSYDDGDAEMSD